jgi:hypothetical protein
MSRTMKIAFPSWMVAATMASVIGVIAMGFLAIQMIAGETAIRRDELLRIRRFEEGLQDYQSAVPADQQTSNASASQVSAASQDPDGIRRVEGVLAQVHDPYIAAQNTLLEAEPEIGSTVDPIDETQAPNAAWAKNPEALSKFVRNNRNLIDSVYGLLESEPNNGYLSDYRMRKVRDLVFWDMADCIVAQDKERFAKGLNAYFRLSEFTGYQGVAHHTALLCLLHRALDEKTIDTKTASRTLKRIASNQAEDPRYDAGFLSDQHFVSFSYRYGGHWMLPSMKQAMFEEWRYRNNLNNPPAMFGDLHNISALKYFTLAVRVALMQAMQDKQGDVKVPEDVLAGLEIPAEIQNILSSSLNGSYLASSLFAYTQQATGLGELKFNLNRDVSSGPFGIRTRYQIPLAEVNSTGN